MAVDAPQLYNEIWCGLRATTLGSTHLSPSDKQIHNAKQFYQILRVVGYNHTAACGILGNMQVESGLSPAAIQNNGNISNLPNNAEHLQDLTNAVMLEYYDHNNPQLKGYAMGLVQWDGTTNNTPAGAQLPSFAIRYDWMWYDWYTQLLRLEASYLLDPSGWGGINGQTTNFWYYEYSGGSYHYTISWANFKNYSGTPEDAAEDWRVNFERGGNDSIQARKDNARYWYNYFQTATYDTELPGGWTAGYYYIFRNSNITYNQPYHGYNIDCIGFVNMVRVCMGIGGITNGTNSLWRNTTGELYWKGTVQQCIDEFGEIPRGAYLFKCYPEGDIGYHPPPQYEGDGIGDFAHIGVYTGHGLGVMQSGGYDAARTHVADTAYHPTQTDPQLDYDWWTHVAFGRGVFFYTYAPSPYRSARTVILFQQMKRKVLKNVKRSV